MWKTGGAAVHDELHMALQTVQDNGTCTSQIMKQLGNLIIRVLRLCSTGGEWLNWQRAIHWGRSQPEAKKFKDGDVPSK